MAIALAALLSLAHNCAPAVAPITLLSVAQAESRFDPLAIGVNGRHRRTLHPSNLADALQQAQGLAARGANFDIGLAQINVANLSRLGLSLSDALDPCRNLAGEARVLSQGYIAAQQTTSDPQTAIRAALSRYNTGDGKRGLRNGYVARVYAAAEEVVPALELVQSPSGQQDRAAGPLKLHAELATGPDAEPPVLDVFARAPPSSVVWGAATPTPPSDPGPKTTPQAQPGDPS